MATTIHRHIGRTAGIVPAVLACFLLLPSAHAQEPGVDYLVTSSTSLRPDADTQRYVIAVRNLTNEPLTDLAIGDSAPPDDMVVSASATDGEYNATTRTWSIPSLQAGAVAELVIVTGAQETGSSAAHAPGAPFWPWWLALGLAVAGLGLLVAGRRERRAAIQTP